MMPHKTSGKIQTEKVFPTFFFARFFEEKKSPVEQLPLSVFISRLSNKHGISSLSTLYLVKGF